LTLRDMSTCLPPHLRLGVLLALGISILGVETTPAVAQRLAPSTGNQPLTYIIARTDRLRIELYQEDDLSLIARVDAQGCVNLPLVGEVRVIGRTIIDAQKAVEAAYLEGRFLKNPKATINVEEYAPRDVSVAGYVKNPGRIPLPIESTLTIVEVITRAGGFTDIAKGTEVSITRVLPDGTKMTETVDVDSLIRGKNSVDLKKTAFKLEPGDIIYVPPRLI